MSKKSVRNVCPIMTMAIGTPDACIGDKCELYSLKYCCCTIRTPEKMFEEILMLLRYMAKGYVPGRKKVR